MTLPKLWIGTEAFFNSKFHEIYPDSSTRPAFIFYGDKIPDDVYRKSNLLLTLGDVIEMGKGKEPRKAVVNTNGKNRNMQMKI